MTARATAYSHQLTPAAEEFLAKLKSDGFPGFAYLTIAELRGVLGQLVPLAGEPEPVARFEETQIPGNPDIPVRIYVPEARETHDPRAVIVYFHGGGWVSGDSAYIDTPVRALANRSGSAVVSVNYRLAPENKYPAALDDAYAAVTWASQHGEQFGWNGSRLVVAGDSVGGNLAAAVALRARDENGPSIAFQLLVYPVLDHDYDNESYRQFGSSWGMLTRTDMTWFHCHYVSHPNQLDLPYVSPARCTDLGALPETLAILPEADPLRDESRTYIERLRAAGVAARATVYPGTIHGFWQLGALLPEAGMALEEAAMAIRSCLSKAPGRAGAVAPD
jgi:acetyl esterase